jgi:hypothetical protein
MCVPNSVRTRMLGADIVFFGFVLYTAKLKKKIQEQFCPILYEVKVP